MTAPGRLQASRVPFFSIPAPESSVVGRRGSSPGLTDSSSLLCSRSLTTRLGSYSRLSPRKTVTSVGGSCFATAHMFQAMTAEELRFLTRYACPAHSRVWSSNAPTRCVGRTPGPPSRSSWTIRARGGCASPLSVDLTPPTRQRAERGLAALGASTARTCELDSSEVRIGGAIRSAGT